MPGLILFQVNPDGQTLVSVWSIFRIHRGRMKLLLLIILFVYSKVPSDAVEVLVHYLKRGPWAKVNAKVIVDVVIQQYHMYTCLQYFHFSYIYFAKLLAKTSLYDTQP